MKNIFVRFLSLFLLAAMLVGAVACAETQTEENDVTTAAVEGDAATEAPVAETTEINAENILGTRDFGGETLTFYSRKYNGAWSSDLIVKEEVPIGEVLLET